MCKRLIYICILITICGFVITTNTTNEESTPKSNDDFKFEISLPDGKQDNFLWKQLKDMVESYKWIPEWWNWLQHWTGSRMRLLNRQCARQLRNMTATQATFLFCALLQAILTEGQLHEAEPEFLAPLENHTVALGRDVYFTCVVNHLSKYRVAWIKSDTKAILAIHTHMVAQNSRFSVTHNGHNTWKLLVSNVQRNDSGTYMCQINTVPMRSQMGILDVVVPADIVNNNESSEDVAIEGGIIRLRCHATGLPEPTVIWRREDNQNIVLRPDGEREKQVLQSFEGETLTLTNVQRTDMGPYLCIAKNGVPPSVSKRWIVRVHFHPLIKVSEQLVAAPLGSDVLVQCYVEASPKAMNHWMRDNGDKLIPNDKYIMEEKKLSEYSLLMNLTIRNLAKKDYGNYICTSSNALGKAEGVVRLQVLNLPTKTTTTVSTPRYIETKPRKPIVTKDKPKKYKQPKKKETGDGKSDEEDEMTTMLSPEIRTQPPHMSVPPPWIDLHRNTAPDYNCYAFMGLVVLHLYTVYYGIVY